jgi:uncharacterized membrane protein
LVSPVRRIVKAILGFLLILVGLLLAVPGIPGPGLALVALGLLLLSEQFPWARRILEWAKQKWNRLRERLKRPGGPAG